MNEVEGRMEQKERFIEYRAAGRSYADIAAALKVSKPTLIGWGRELETEIINARTLRMDELFEKFAVAKTKRVEVFGTRLDGMLKELDDRNLKEVPTQTLLKLALDYGKALAAEETPLRMRGEESWGDDIFPTKVRTWSA